MDTSAVRKEAVTDTKEFTLEKWELLSCDKKVKSLVKKHSKAE